MNDSNTEKSPHEGLSEFEALRAAWALLVEELIETGVIDREKLYNKFEDLFWLEGDSNSGHIEWYLHALRMQKIYQSPQKNIKSKE